MSDTLISTTFCPTCGGAGALDAEGKRLWGTQPAMRCVQCDGLGRIYENKNLGQEIPESPAVVEKPAA